MLRIAAILGFVSLAAASAPAEQYWIVYEGNDFPENEGWTRNTSGGGAERWIEDGTLVIDSTSSIDIYDAYQHFDVRRPGPGELFVGEWRMRVDVFVTYYDATLGISRPDPRRDMQIEHAVDHIRVPADWTVIDVAPGDWHSYRIESSDMDAYALLVDGVHVYDGYFESPSILDPFVAFGDTRIGAASLSRWDYVRFGIVPESESLMLLTIVAGAACARRKR